MADIFRTIIVTVESQEAAQLIAVTYDGGDGMFTVGCSPSGTAPATHYISSGFVDEEMTVSLAEVSGIDISEDPPFTAMARMNIQLVSE